MKFSTVASTLALATSVLALPYGDKQSNSLSQVQKITVEQNSGNVKLQFDKSKVSLGKINTGNTASVSASQSADQSNYAKRSADQSNNLNQVQDITVDQKSGNVDLWIDGSAVNIGNINTGNTAIVSASQSADQSNYAKRSGRDQSNNLNQVQDITVDQKSGNVDLWIDGSAVNIGNINTGNTASVSASQSADQSNYAKRSGGGHQSNNLNQVQDITVDQQSGNVDLWIDGSAVNIGNINTGNTARVSASQSAKQNNS